MLTRGSSIANSTPTLAKTALVFVLIVVMAALRSKKANMQYGSASWVSTERDSARQFVQDEVEEFEYSVINEMEWLNEHMADIFGKTRKYVYRWREAVYILLTCDKGVSPISSRRQVNLEARLQGRPGNETLQKRGLYVGSYDLWRCG